MWAKELLGEIGRRYINGEKMDVQKQLIKHANEMIKVDEKYRSRFQHSYDVTVNSKARNLQALDKIVKANVDLDKQMSELDTALAITISPK